MSDHDVKVIANLHRVCSCRISYHFSSPQGPYKQSQSSYVVAAAMEEQILIPSAKDIQLLLSNIGASHTASIPTIESLIQENCSDDGAGSGPVTADKMIDLIARIRSM